MAHNRRALNKKEKSNCKNWNRASWGATRRKYPRGCWRGSRKNSHQTQEVEIAQEIGSWDEQGEPTQNLDILNIFSQITENNVRIMENN